MNEWTKSLLRRHDLTHIIVDTFPSVTVSRAGDNIPWSPQLPAVARWLAEHGIETLHGLVDAGVRCLDVGGGIEFDDPAEQVRLIASGRALLAALAALETTEGGG